MIREKISIVIPAFNEKLVIAGTIKKVKLWLQQNAVNYEIIVVDDGSYDRTLAILKTIPDIIVLRNLRNHGKGYTVRKGVLAATGELILFMDADSSTDISELSKLLPYIQDYQLVIGSRALASSKIIKSQNKLKIILGKSGNLLVRLLLSLPLKDTQCGFKLFTRDYQNLFRKMIINGWGFDFEIIYLGHRAGYKIKEVPVIWENNFDSKVTVGGYLKTLWELIKIRLYYFFKK